LGSLKAKPQHRVDRQAVFESHRLAENNQGSWRREMAGGAVVDGVVSTVALFEQTSKCLTVEGRVAFKYNGLNGSSTWSSVDVGVRKEGWMCPVVVVR
jgi:hypothetical protein